MPYMQPRSLSDQEVYALTAYLLAANKLIGENDEINAEDAAEGADAEPGQFHHPVPGPDLSLLSRRFDRRVRRKRVAARSPLPNPPPQAGEGIRPS